jgi:dephospho-CoA kinase
MSLRVGLTGGLASGKTTVAEMFAARGAYIMYADRAAHEAMQPGELAYQEVLKTFGESVLNADGSINRKKLAELAFGNGRITELNRIVHPAVRDRMERWMEETAEFDQRAIMIFEAALILEAGLGKYFHKLIVVKSRPEQKLERFLSRVVDASAMEPEERGRVLRDAERRIGAQLSDQEKAAAADYLIDNSGTRAETERQVNAIYKELQKLAGLQAQASTRNRI